MKINPSSVLPALRAKLGDRWYYVTTLSFSQVAKWIKPVDKIHERKELKTWIQRILRPERKEAIASYLINQEQRFFNAVVAGIYGGEPEWFPVEVGNSVTVKEIRVGDRQATAFGLLMLSGNEDIFAIDGQHRWRVFVRRCPAPERSKTKSSPCCLSLTIKQISEGNEQGVCLLH